MSLGVSGVTLYAALARAPDVSSEITRSKFLAIASPFILSEAVVLHIGGGIEQHLNVSGMSKITMEE